MVLPDALFARTVKPEEKAKQDEDMIRSWVDPHQLKKINGVWQKDGRTVVTAKSPYTKQLIHDHHDSPIHSHPGISWTTDLVQRRYWWPRLRQDVIQCYDPSHGGFYMAEGAFYIRIGLPLRIVSGDCLALSLYGLIDRYLRFLHAHVRCPMSGDLGVVLVRFIHLLIMHVGTCSHGTLYPMTGCVLYWCCVDNATWIC